MNAQAFLNNFGYLVNAPDGVKRLREMVYHLAITGTLCAQDDAEGNGAELLETMMEEKQKRIKSGLFKRTPKLENLKGTFSDSLPGLPETWAWSRLVDIGEISPKNHFDDETPASFATMSTISEMHGVSPKPEERPWGNVKKGYTHFADGDVVVAKITPCFENGKAAVMRELTGGIGAGTTELHVVRPLPGLEPSFIYNFVRSPYFKIVGEAHMTGTAGQKRLPTEYFATRPFPVPPHEEQKRIVAKVDELMALCDKLEAQQQERERLFPVLSLAAHTRFAECPTLEYLKAIFDETRSVLSEDLRKTILSLAIKGQLVSQSDQIEHTSTTLSNHLDAREKVARSLKLKRPLSPSAVFMSGFSVPDTWCLASPDQISAIRKNALTIGPFGSSLLKSDYRESGVPLVFVRDIRSENYGGPDTRFISQSKAVELESHTVQTGDLLVTKMGDPPGDTSIYPKGRPSGVITADCIKLTPCNEIVLTEYLRYALRAPELAQQFLSQTRGVAHKKISLGRFRVMAIPLPPLEEQHRIVAKVDQFMALVGQLEEQRNQKAKVATAFAQATVAAITGTKTKAPEHMKAPKTELITKLETGTKPKATEGAPLAKIIAKHKGSITAKVLWQQSGLEIDTFYQQLKTEMASGWIVEPVPAVMKEVVSS
ncbi:MAG: restriction endonuclease subunit S [Candidatus Thiodiazotropha sp. (ex Lucinoma annulata)]|nr:restriction endonuclease subunit S [Candidatus Thiodiazotropha sp. (ex Lucinoma annulata)]